MLYCAMQIWCSDEVLRTREWNFSEKNHCKRRVRQVLGVLDAVDAFTKGLITFDLRSDTVDISSTTSSSTSSKLYLEGRQRLT